MTSTQANGTVDALWQGYREGAVPPDASDIQVLECRRAFYAGAISILNAMSENLTGEDDLTREDEAFMQCIQAELALFIDNVMAGRG